MSNQQRRSTLAGVLATMAVGLGLGLAATGCSRGGDDLIATTDDDSAAATTDAAAAATADSPELDVVVEDDQTEHSTTEDSTSTTSRARGNQSNRSDRSQRSNRGSVKGSQSSSTTAGSAATSASSSPSADNESPGDDHDHESPGPLETTPSSTPATNAMESAVKQPSKANVWQPAPRTSWQWQLTGPLDTTVDVDVYDVDLFDTPTATISELKGDGRTVICYFSAGAWEDWRPDAKQFDSATLGNSNGWPGERWLNIANLNRIKPLINARLDLAVQKGCDAVEPDNIDGYQNDSGFPLTASDQIVFNTYLARAAHDRGLSIGLKNAAELVGVLQPSFDWALVEECVAYNECAAYKPFVDNGKAVFHVEYGGNLGWCAETKALGFSSIEKDDDLSAVYRPCP